MIIGSEEAKQISGRFFEYEYETTVARIPGSENFGCFKGNDLKEFKIVQKVYCWSDKCFDHVMNGWRTTAKGLLSMYSYRGLGKTCERSFTASEVCERIYKNNNFKYTASLITIGAIDIIQ
jgi:hypothetical protein